MRGRLGLEWIVGLAVVVALLLGARHRGMGQDEGIWMLVARAWVDDGVPPYQGPIDNKPPGIFYVFALTYALSGVDHRLPRLLGVLAALGTCLILYALGRRLGDRFAGAMAALAGGLVLANPALGGRVATESFMVFLTALAVQVVVVGAAQPPARRTLSQLGAGVLLGLAITFKQVAALTAPALVAWTWAMTPHDRRTVGRSLTGAGLIAAGTAIGAALGLAPLLLAGVTMAEYWQGAWTTLLDPGSALYPLSARLPNLARLVDYPLVVLTIAAAILPAVAPRRAWMPVAVWFGVGVLAPAASGYFIGHQLRTIVPPGALALGLLACAGASRVPRPARRRATVAVVAALALLPYQPAIDLVMGRPPQRHYAAHEEVGAWIRSATAPDDLVFAWVTGGLMQAIAGRSSPSRHADRTLARTPAASAEVARDLAARPPRLIVVQDAAPAWLERVLAERYVRVFEQGPLTVHQRRPRLDATP